MDPARGWVLAYAYGVATYADLEAHLECEDEEPMSPLDARRAMPNATVARRGVRSWTATKV
jgi:hypothetical protein